MGYRLGRDAVNGYVWIDDPSITLSSGPSYARDADKDDPPYEKPKQPLGFAPGPRETEPLLWEGED